MNSLTIFYVILFIHLFIYLISSIINITTLRSWLTFFLLFSCTFRPNFLSTAVTYLDLFPFLYMIISSVIISTLWSYFRSSLMNIFIYFSTLRTDFGFLMLVNVSALRSSFSRTVSFSTLRTDFDFLMLLNVSALRSSFSRTASSLTLIRAVVSIYNHMRFFLIISSVVISTLRSFLHLTQHLLILTFVNIIILNTCCSWFRNNYFLILRFSIQKTYSILLTCTERLWNKFIFLNATDCKAFYFLTINIRLTYYSYSFFIFFST